MRYLYFLIVVCLTYTSYAQEKKSFDAFTKDFTKALDKRFSEDELNKMFRKYDALLTPHSDITHLSERLKSDPISLYPLSDFKNEKLYTDHINYLLNSSNPYQRILAYLIIAASGDLTKENILLHKIRTEVNAGNLIWSGMALLYLNCDHTTALFDFLVKNEDFGDAHMLPLYIKLNKDSLQQTAYKRINSQNIKAKVLAAQILSVTNLNSQTESFLKQAVKDWDISIKGYAIYSIKELRIGNLLEIFKPLLDSSKTRAIALEALANSPTVADQNYLYQLADKADTIREDLLDCFYKSKSDENIKYWLKLLYTKPIATNYVFFIFEQPLISSDKILPDLQTALLNIQKDEIKGELVRALKGRSDDKSIEIMISFLRSNSSTVRYWTATTLEGNPSPKLNIPDVKVLISRGMKYGNR